MSKFPVTIAWQIPADHGKACLESSNNTSKHVSSHLTYSFHFKNTTTFCSPKVLYKNEAPLTNPSKLTTQKEITTNTICDQHKVNKVCFFGDQPNHQEFSYDKHYAYFSPKEQAKLTLLVIKLQEFNVHISYNPLPITPGTMIPSRTSTSRYEYSKKNHKKNTTFNEHNWFRPQREGERARFMHAMHDHEPCAPILAY